MPHKFGLLRLMWYVFKFFRLNFEQMLEWTLFYMKTEQGYVNFNNKGWLTAVAKQSQVTLFQEKTHDGQLYLQIASGEWKDRYVGGDWTDGIGAYLWSGCDYLKWDGNRLQSKSGRTAGHHMVYRKSNGFFYFFNNGDSDYFKITVTKIRPFYWILYKNQYAKLDESGWLTVTDSRETATIFRDVEYQGKIYVLICSGDWKNKYIGGHRVNGVGAYIFKDTDNMEWNGNRLQSQSGFTSGHHLVFRKSNKYFYFYDSEDFSEYDKAVDCMYLGSMVSIIALLQHPDIGIETKKMAIECLNGSQIKEENYVTSKIRGFRTTEYPWEWEALNLGYLKSKNKQTTFSSDSIGPMLSSDMTEDSNNLIVLAMRLLAVNNSFQPRSQFVCVAPTLEIAKQYKGRIFSFDVIPNCPLLTKDGVAQYQILGGTTITNVKLERDYSSMI